MGGTDGGIRMHCPNCESLQICAAIPPTALGTRSFRRLHHGDFPDIKWFRRGRQCQKCTHKFLTAEVDDSFLDELVAFRVAADRLGEALEAYLARDESGLLLREAWDIAYRLGKRPIPGLDRELESLDRELESLDETNDSDTGIAD